MIWTLAWLSFPLASGEHYPIKYTKIYAWYAFIKHVCYCGVFDVFGVFGLFGVFGVLLMGITGEPPWSLIDLIIVYNRGKTTRPYEATQAACTYRVCVADLATRLIV